MKLFPCINSRTECALLLLGNTVVAVFLGVLTDHGFLVNFYYSQAIGLSIAGVSSISTHLGQRTLPTLRDVVIGVLFGGALGFWLGSLLNQHSLLTLWYERRQMLVSGIASVFVFGFLLSFIFYHRMQAMELAARVKDEQLRQLAQEKLLEQARLQVLQARIAPHFLFNTLANILGLIDQQPDNAKTMLIHLTDLLRGHLAPAGRPLTTLADELDLLRAYLGIMAIRMGPRLSWDIEAEPAVLACALPPLLLQPLVENALRHGLEPKPAGGHLHIRCQRRDAALEISIADDGLGLLVPSSHPGAGMGLANIRARLALACGATARLDIMANASGGATSHLTLPLEPACAS